MPTQCGKSRNDSAGAPNMGHVTHGSSLKAPIPLTSISSSSRLFSTLCGFAFDFAFLQEDTFERIFSHGSDLSRNVKRIKGADRQVPIKGAWHWNAFEQEPEKTWTSMEVHFQDLVDVTPPEPCRVPPFEGVNTLRMDAGRWIQAELKNTTIGDEKCDSDAVLVSRWNQATAAGISS